MGHFGAGTIFERQVWGLGIYDRATDDAQIYIVGNNRSADRLLPIIQAHVYTNEERPTQVYTDLWAAYNRLAELGYYHIRVNHSLDFGFGTYFYFFNCGILFKHIKKNFLHH